jgi:hypothetical protein
MHTRLSRTEWLALGIGLSIAIGFFIHQCWYPSSLYDAAQYVEMGRHIADRGILSRFMESQVRTYGYPLFLSPIVLIAGTTGLPFVLVLFLVQLGLYVAAAAAFRRALAPWSVPAARVAFCGLMVNYYALLYTTEPLTESLSLTALVLLGAGWLTAYRRRGPLRLLTALALLAGFSILIRPANIFMAVTALAGIVLIGVRHRVAPGRAAIAASLVAACVALPFVPQLVYNGTQFGRWTPLLARDLGKRQQAWGIQDLKYATAMPPIADSAVHYANPWLRGTTLDDAAPLSWYRAHPRRAALTLALHSFNLTDQDLLFTYSRDLDPWYRVPLGLINHAAVILGFIGLIICGYRAARGRDQAIKDAGALLAVLLGGVWALHVWTAVEMRFGLALLCILFPFAGYALLSVARSNRWGDHEGRPYGSRRRATIVVTGVIVAAYVAGALRLSAWVRDQSPLIRATVASRRADGRHDADGDGVPDDVDRCPTAYAASADGCAVPATPSGDWDGSGTPRVVFVDTTDGSAHGWTLANGVKTGTERLSRADDPRWMIVGTSDLTADGRADLLWQNRETGAVRLFAMPGSSNADGQALLPSVGDSDWRIAGTGDFNGDGAADIVWQHRRTGNVAIWYMAGRAVLQSVAYVTTDLDAAILALAPWRVVGTLDFDADGSRDLALENSATGDVTIARLGPRSARGVPLLQRVPAAAVGADWDVRAIANYAGDGRDDVVLQQTSTGQVALWVRDSDGFLPFHDLGHPPTGWEVAGPR